MSSGVRKRSRELLRAELAKAAADYIADVGLENTTVADIAGEIGVSRATFHRYFHSKEDAIVAAVRATRISAADCVRTADASTGDSVWATVRRAFDPVVDAINADAAALRKRAHLIESAAPVRARLASLNDVEREELTSALLDWVPDVLQAQAVAGATVLAFELAWTVWSTDENADFGPALDRAFEAITAVATLRLDPL
ncbi:hypothetical protein GCM10027271_01780 [Saccharopolyspora gloriosae]|uniref:AcrR family transcriptional regulator n=1 Tax=Saccharopolyspora gloriosae TaxID=455344 RepID=A0A840NKJ8_9PSEU|nr:TetR/AcrR family transcriptional regulator [Saccharopolyspora gloriosae]MBB5070555.1 AcrR family transcriptional regulator [Saccharopolyspora gloriosae]